jgi:hypothetical protein
VYDACQEAGYILFITADHGNAEQMINPETGAPHTAHTTNPVPFIMTGDPSKLKFKEDKKKEEEEEEGALCDVAPTVLDIMVRFSPVDFALSLTHRFFLLVGRVCLNPKVRTSISLSASLAHYFSEMTGRSLLVKLD